MTDSPDKDGEKVVAIENGVDAETVEGADKSGKRVGRRVGRVEGKGPPSVPGTAVGAPAM